ncbi:MAG: Clp1/GlmU family protein [Synergistetes bacterium]|nr:Clp1/GlmU family protein [Synergistota bacterium]MCX8128262.1 Clp1/GlmU family protein [Synergistota bacterium]MDW8192709.1 Clp1/GlmU family protein [Synergistota bacterium]
MVLDLSDQERIIILLGKVDTGKTTLALLLANKLISEGKKVAVVDADPGQSDIGPPGTLGLGFLDGKVEKLSEVSPVKLAFIGSTSPGGPFIWPTLWGLGDLVSFACRDRDIVIIDSSGLIMGKDGYTLVKSKISVVKPDVVIFLGNERDYLHLIDEFSRYTRVVVLPSPSGVRIKTLEERRSNRIKMWKAYFKNAIEVELAWNDVKVGGFPHFGVGIPLSKTAVQELSFKIGTGILWAEKCNGKLKILTVSYPERGIDAELEWIHIGSLKHTLLGLEGNEGLLDVGLVLEIDERKLLIKTPCTKIGDINKILLSKLRVDEEVFK